LSESWIVAFETFTNIKKIAFWMVHKLNLLSWQQNLHGRVVLCWKHKTNWQIWWKVWTDHKGNVTKILFLSIPSCSTKKYLKKFFGSQCIQFDFLHLCRKVTFRPSYRNFQKSFIWWYLQIL
jgi:hypothetical protein